MMSLKEIQEAFKGDDENLRQAALADLDRHMLADADNAEAIYLLGFYFILVGNPPLAYNLFMRSFQLSGNDASCNNVGLALSQLGRDDDAMEWFFKALKVNPRNASAMNHIALTMCQRNRYAEAKHYCLDALKIKDTPETRTTLSFALMALGEWEQGLVEYTHSLYTKHRVSIDYGLPIWSGEKDAVVIVHGEQGIGDEIMYARHINDMAYACKQVIVDCDHRLRHLFQRSFPHARVFGDRRAEHRPWVQAEGATHSIAAGELMRFFTPDGPARMKRYIETDPALVRMYEALFLGPNDRQSYDAGGDAGTPVRKVIGLTWSGGTRGTGRDRRTFDDEALETLVAGVVHNHSTPHGPPILVSLEYDPQQALRGAKFGIQHRHFAVGRGASYDQTAALIDSLDLVIGTDTAAHHCAGAVGTPSVMFVHEYPLWSVSEIHGARHGWYHGVEIHRKKRSESWAQAINRYFNG